MPLLRLAEFLVLACLPGCWVTFLLRPAWMSWYTKLFVGAAISPLLLVGQLYIALLIGLTFEYAAIALVCLNSLTLVPILRDVRKISLPPIGTIAGACFVLGTTFFALAPQFTNRNLVLYSSDAWLRAGSTYMVANSHIVLEEPSLAGVRLAYPWGGHAFQALLSYVLDSTPAYSYIWTNLLWIVIFYALGAALANEFGLKPLSAAFAPIWLFFGVNFGGQVLRRAAAHGFPIVGGLLGDYRYSTWILYFVFPGHMLFAVGMLLAMLLILVRSSLWVDARKNLTCLAVLLFGIGFVYPILYPVAAVLVAGRIAAETVEPIGDQGIRWKRILLLVVLVASATLFTLAYLILITRDRTTPAVLFSGLGLVNEFAHATTRIGKTLELLVATAPLWIALGVTIRWFWRRQRPAMIVLCSGAVASGALYTVLFMPYFQNEYKFMFTAAICLAIFPAMAMERLMNRMGKRAIAVAMVTTLVLSTPLLIQMYKYGPWWGVLRGPRLAASGFDLRMDDSERFAAVTDAIRTRTPVETVVVAEDTGFYLPAVTRRPLFIAAKRREGYAGVGVPDDLLLKGAKGYDAKLIDDRRAVQYTLFHSGDQSQIAQSLNRILELKRPIVVIVDARVHGDLSKLLSELGEGQYLFQGQDVAGWFLKPHSDISGRQGIGAIGAPTQNVANPQ